MLKLGDYVEIMDLSYTFQVKDGRIGRALLTNKKGFVREIRPQHDPYPTMDYQQTVLTGDAIGPNLYQKKYRQLRNTVKIEVGSNHYVFAPIEEIRKLQLKSKKTIVKTYKFDVGEETWKLTIEK